MYLWFGFKHGVISACFCRNRFAELRLLLAGIPIDFPVQSVRSGSCDRSHKPLRLSNFCSPPRPVQTPACRVPRKYRTPPAGATSRVHLPEPAKMA